MLLPALLFTLLPSSFLRYPTVAGGRVAFVHADQIWISPLSGGQAAKLTDSPGTKSHLHFSPDGRTLAFSSDGEGNESVYCLRLADNFVTRVTHNPSGARLCGWTPSGDLLFASAVFVPNDQGDWKQLFAVPPTGGLPKQAPLTAAADGAFRPDGGLLAFVDFPSQDLNWKRNSGGAASKIWSFEPASGKTKRLTPWRGMNACPMWHGDTLYYLSDQGTERRMNLWKLDFKGQHPEQLTSFSDFDVDDPCMGSAEIVFQRHGTLFRYGLASRVTSEIEIALPTVSPREERSPVVMSAMPTDHGQVVAEAGGDIWMWNATEGKSKNLTHSDAVAERSPVISPNGSEIAFLSDRAGEYDLCVMNSDGSGMRRLTSRTNGFPTAPSWSPDSQYLAFSDNSGAVFVVSKATCDVTQIDRDAWEHANQLSWSPDSKWLVYTKTEPTMMQAVWAYDTAGRTDVRLTAGMFKDSLPTFDRRGEYLLFASDRDPRSRAFDSFDGSSFVYPVRGALMVMPLKGGTPLPWQPHPHGQPFGIDANEGERRASILTQTPLAPSRLAVSFSGDLVFLDSSGKEPSIKMLDFTHAASTGRLERTLASGADEFSLSPMGKVLLIRKGGRYTTLDLTTDNPQEKPVDLGSIRQSVDLTSEWTQMFSDAWRFCRDYFYDKHLSGVDWQSVRRRYEPLVGACSTRSEFDYVVGQLLGELRTSHCFLRGRSNAPHPADRTGMLAVDFVVANGAYRIKRIYDAAAWDTFARSPLRRPGLQVREGDYILAVNGKPFRTDQDPWAAFSGTASTPTRLKISAKPVLDDSARDVAVVPQPDDSYVRGRAWMEENRDHVDKLSQGRIGYIYVPDTLDYGTDAFVRQLLAQSNKEALIVDDRWNGGGRMPDRFLELLRRVPVWDSVRQNTLGGSIPAFASKGPKCMLINGGAKSGGDSLAALFRKWRMGPLIGMPTMGARGGSGGSEPPSFTDGSGVLVPHVGFVDTDGKWSVGDSGVSPDIWIADDPAAGNVQLDTAIGVMLSKLPRKHG